VYVFVAVECAEQKCLKVLVVKTEGKRQFGKLGHRWEEY